MKFELEQKLNEWLQSMTPREEFTRADLAEMEGHLRDSWEELRRRGLSGEEAFWLASRRLGNADELGGEFEKVNSTHQMTCRLLWMVGGFLAISLLLLLSRLFGSLSLLVDVGFPVAAVTGAWMRIGLETGMLLVLCATAFRNGPGLVNFSGRWWQKFDGLGAGMKITLLIGGFLLLALGPVIAGIPNIFLARTYSVEEIGQYQFRLAMFGLIKSALLPILLGWAVIRLARIRRIHRSA